jgi:hypothetical protein
VSGGSHPCATEVWRRIDRGSGNSRVTGNSTLREDSRQAERTRNGAGDLYLNGRDRREKTKV